MKNLGEDVYYIMGKNCFEETLKWTPERLIKVFFQHSSEKIKALKPLLDQRKIPYQLTEKERLTHLVGSDSHQGIVALVRPKKFTDLDAYLKAEKKTDLVVVLDQITDPQNVGAILRAAECLGAKAVIWSKNRGCGMTPVVAKASVGASEWLPIIQVSNLVESVKKCQRAGYWVAAADANPPAKPIDAVQWPEKVVVILGSEGAGLQPLLKKQVNEVVYIPQVGRISSLNVSQAAAIMLYQILRSKEV